MIQSVASTTGPSALPVRSSTAKNSMMVRYALVASGGVAQSGATVIAVDVLAVIIRTCPAPVPLSIISSLPACASTSQLAPLSSRVLAVPPVAVPVTTRFMSSVVASAARVRAKAPLLAMMSPLVISTSPLVAPPTKSAASTVLPGANVQYRIVPGATVVQATSKTTTSPSLAVVVSGVTAYVGAAWLVSRTVIKGLV